jgi:signal transduction histidine kinase
MTLTRRHACLMMTAGLAVPVVLGPMPLLAASLQRAAVMEMVSAASAALAEHGFPRALSHTADDVWARPDQGLYVFVLDQDGVLMLHPDRKMEGRNVINTLDPDGKPFIREMMAAALAASGAGCWTDYVWPLPDTGALAAKHTYSKLTGPLIVAAGYYAETT